MILRPADAKWFELLVAREELPGVLRCLAATGLVELQAHSDVSAAHLLPALRAVLDEYKRLAQRYARYWPATAAAVERPCEPKEIAEAALNQLRAWASSADPLIARLQQLAQERAQLEVLGEMLAEPAELPDLSRLGQAGPHFAARAYALDRDGGALRIPPAVLVLRLPRRHRVFLLALGLKEQVAAFDETLSALKARAVELPRDLPPKREAALAWITERIASIATQTQALDAQLAHQHGEHALSAALADLQFTEWLVDHVPELAMTEHFAWVTGWTSDASGERIESALKQADVRYLLHFPDAPTVLTRPVVLRNPAWVRAFEIFPKLLGMPTSSEADPSTIVALLAPLMFGFMFGDVGQGFVLVLAGIALRRKYPGTALLISGGVAAMAFGFLFGSLFTREDILPALWLRPLDEPLALFGVSLALGACVIVAGMVLDAIQHHWSREGLLWWRSRAGLMLCYVALIGSALDLRALWALPAGLVWTWVGESLWAPSTAPQGRGRRLGASVGHSVETLLQLAVNTISFVRVGAFALAHAGLSAAIEGLAGASDTRTGFWVIVALGNLITLIVEGLVVSVQTTRLILFEFFVRFLRGSGRPFRPLGLPPTSVKYV